MASHTFAPLSLLAMTLALAPGAAASGFQLREQSPSAQGCAFSGVSAGGEDIGAMFFNPAALAHYEGNQAVLGFSQVIPSTTLDGGSATRAALLGGSVISGPASHPNAAERAALPNLYAMWSLGSLKLGLSINVPFGLVTRYEDGWIGRYHAVKSDLKTYDIAPSLAYRLNPRWSLGLAIVARKTDAELSNAVDFGSIGALSMPAPYNTYFTPGTLDGLATVSGSAWAYGYKAGVLYEPSQALRIGLAYQSKTNVSIKGDVRYQDPSPAAQAQWGLAYSALKAAGHFVDGPAQAALPLPATASLGLAWDLGPRLSLKAEAAWTGWSTFKELRVAFGSGQADSITHEGWKDSWFYSLGLGWKLNERWLLRAGVGADKTPVEDATRTPRIPDSDRTWLSTGFAYRPTRTFRFDVAYSHLFAGDAAMDLHAGADPTGPDFFRGNLRGTYKNAIDILTAQVRIDF